MIVARMSLEDCMREADAARGRWAVRLESEARAAAQNRRYAREINNPWKGTEFSRLTFDWAATRAHIDEELKGNLTRLRARGRSLARNNSYVRQYLHLLRWNVLGHAGIRYQAQVRNNDGNLNEGINDKLEDAWCDWCEAPTVDGKQTLVEFSGTALETVANEGEAFVRLHRGRPEDKYGLALELVDPDRVDELYFRYPTEGTEIRMGVEIDTYGRPMAYHIWTTPYNLVGISQDRKRERVPASDIIHLFKTLRTNQSRGVSWHAQNMFALNMIDGYEEAELVAARLHASTSMVLTRKDGSVGAPLGDEEGSIEFDANPGGLMIAPDGYEFNTWAPQHPSPNMSPFIKSMLRKVASGWGISYNQLANDLEGVNYSSMRSGLLTERDTWRGHQRWFTDAFMRPVHRQWLGMATITGQVVLDARPFDKFADALWIPRGWPWVDPKNDTEAGILQIQAGLASRTELLAAQGQDLELILEQLQDEQKMAKQFGVDIAGPAKPLAVSSAEPDAAAAGATSGGQVPDAVASRNGALLNGRGKR